MFGSRRAMARLQRGAAPPDAADRRRRLGRVLAIATAPVAAFHTVVWATSDTESIQSMWVTGEVTADGSLVVQEVIDWDFTVSPGGDHHGIYRRIDDREVDDLVVSSPNAPANAEITTYDDSVSVRIGDAGTTVQGHKRYEIGYRLDDVVAGRSISWDAVGDSWEAPIGRAEVHLVAPFELDAPTCSAGRSGRSGGCSIAQPEPGHLVVKVSGLDEYRGITVGARAGDPLASAPSLPDPPGQPMSSYLGIVMRFLTVAALIAGSAGIVWMILRRLGRDEVAGTTTMQATFGDTAGEVHRVDSAELSQMAPMDVAPPQGLTAAQAGVVFDDGVQLRHQVAWLLSEVVGGALAIVEQSGAPGTVVLRRTGPGSDHAVAVLDTIFAGRSEVALGAGHDAAFAEGWQAIADQLDKWYLASDATPHDRSRAIKVLEPVGGVLGYVGLAGGLFTTVLANRSVSGIDWLPLAAAAVTGVGMVLAWGSSELERNTPARSALWLRVESFRKFLESSEAAHVQRAAAMGLVREYAPWAVALGQAHHWNGLLSSPGHEALALERSLMEITPRLSSMLADYVVELPTSPSDMGGLESRGRRRRSAPSMAEDRDRGDRSGDHDDHEPMRDRDSSLVGGGRGGGGGGSW